MSSPDPGDLLELALSAARAAGLLLHEGRPEKVLVANTKSSSTDVVTAMDRAAEALIIEHVLAVRPYDGVLGEEQGERLGSSGVRWVIDPIDGTVNYLYGIPQWAVSIGVEVDARAGSGPGAGPVMVAGVVHDPAKGETWTAVRGGGAFVARAGADPQQIQVSEVTTLEQTLLATGFGYDPARRARQLAVLAPMITTVRDIRRLGAASLDLVSVACGRLDAYMEAGLGPWDLAAGGLIAAEAGAVVSGLRGLPAGEALTVAVAPGIATALLELLTELNADQVL